ncbi:MAG: hypothetical protein V3R25_09885 [Nitrosomonadaceae bacterium]
MKKFIGCFCDEDILLDDVEDRVAIELIEHLETELGIRRANKASTDMLGLTYREANRLHNLRISEMAEKAAMGEPCFKAEEYEEGALPKVNRPRYEFDFVSELFGAEKEESIYKPLTLKDADAGRIPVPSDVDKNTYWSEHVTYNIGDKVTHPDGHKVEIVATAVGKNNFSKCFHDNRQIGDKHCPDCDLPLY